MQWDIGPTAFATDASDFSPMFRIPLRQKFSSQSRRPPQTAAGTGLDDYRPTKEAAMRFQTQISEHMLSKLKGKAHQEVDSFTRLHFRIKEMRATKEAQDRVHTFNAIRAALSR